MNAIRNTLTTGFLTHLETNILLSNIFDLIIPDETIRLDKNQKRELYSKQSVKSYKRTNERNKNRGNKSRGVENFLEDTN